LAHGLMWLILAAVLISAGNAIVRKAFDTSSNGLLEIQWYLFAGVFMLGSSYGLLRNSHVRIDFISSKLGARARATGSTSSASLSVLIPLAAVSSSYWAGRFFETRHSSQARCRKMQVA
jgi:TRAP-type mannitol/chloroaromatic compound transport system permease small subunit